jgi:SAM-dependent methyltransferase
MLKSLSQRTWTKAYSRNDQNILSLLEPDRTAVALDIGCGDGQKTLTFQERIGCPEMTGVDGVAGRLEAAEARGVKTQLVNLEEKWPLPSESFDVAVSNQVIEHLLNIDNFISEIERVLKPGGYCVISTENLASWYNIGALTLGFQDFSHHLINKVHTGNPFSIHAGEKTATWSADDNSGVDDTAFPHIKIFTYKSLKTIFEVYGFEFVAGKGSGLGPLVRPVHSHFIVVKVRKPLTSE